MNKLTSIVVVAVLIVTGRAVTGATEPEIEVVAAGDIEPASAILAPSQETGDSGENDESFPHQLPPPMPPNHGHIAPTPSEPAHPPTAHGSPEADKPRSWYFDPQINLGNDPQLAVGPKFIVGIEAHTIAFFDKNGALLEPQKGKTAKIPARQSASQFFAVFLQPHLNNNPAKNVRDVNWTIPNAAPGFHDPHLACDPENPTKFGGCVVEAYDTRALYDKWHDRFWIESNLRNEVQTDSDTCDPKKDACVKDGSPFKRRFEAVAISKTRNPLDGFFSIVFRFNKPGDWPRIGVHNHWFILGSNGSTTVHLFDSDALVIGSRNFKDIFRGTFTGADFDNPDHVYPVVQHDSRNESDPKAKPFIPGTGDSTDVPTFLVATSGSRITIFAFDDFAGKPPLMSSSIDLGHDAPWLQSPAVYRDGKIYMAGTQCVDGDGSGCRHAVNIVIIPVHRDGNKKIAVNKSVREGFADFLLGGDYGRGGSYEISAIEVNKDNDYAVVYDRSDPGLVPGVSASFEPSAYYSVFLHDETGHRNGALRPAACGPPFGRCGVTNPDSAHLDVAGIAVDPSDDTTFWMSHGYASAGTSKLDLVGTYKMVIGAVKPRTNGYIPANPKQVP
jgi:hypothetical protein